MKRKKIQTKITAEQLRKMRRAADRLLGLQQIKVGTGYHKSAKDYKRSNTIKNWDDES